MPLSMETPFPVVQRLKAPCSDGQNAPAQPVERARILFQEPLSPSCGRPAFPLSAGRRGVLAERSATSRHERRQSKSGTIAGCPCLVMNESRRPKALRKRFCNSPPSDLKGRKGRIGHKGRRGNDLARTFPSAPLFPFGVDCHGCLRPLAALRITFYALRLTR
jgi:hypothetical protein